MRIAAPVCALVRNDMLKERRVRGYKYVVCGDIQKTGMCQRVQERLVRKVRGNMPGVSGGKALGRDGTSPTVIARSEATWQSVTPAAQHSRKQRLGQIRKSTTNLPKVVPVCQVSLRGCGLPRLVAQKSAMPCSGLWPEQGNAPLGLLSPQSGTLCGAPMHWFAMASINLPPVRGHKNRQGRLQNRRRPHCFPVVYLYSSTSFSRCS